MVICGDGADDPADDPAEVTPSEFERNVQKLMEVSGIDRARAEEICNSGEMPQDVMDLILATMADKFNMSKEEAAEILENGPRLDEYGATRGCQCEGCRAKRAAVEERITARRAARFN